MKNTKLSERLLALCVDANAITIPHRTMAMFRRHAHGAVFFIAVGCAGLPLLR
jgi:hypothetical protein